MYHASARKRKFLLTLGGLILLVVACSHAPRLSPTATSTAKILYSPTIILPTFTTLPTIAPSTLSLTSVPPHTPIPTPSRSPTVTPNPPTATATATIPFTPVLPTVISTATFALTPGRIAAVIGLSYDYIQGNSIIILDENLNIINRFPRSDLRLTDFSQDRCHLRAINYIDGRFVIRELNFFGVETRQIVALSTEKEDETKIYQFDLSPSGRWLAYKVVDQYGMSLEGGKIQDIRLLPVNEQKPQDILRLTQGGGARPARSTWSWDSHFIAYTDYDDSGVIQIFLFNPEEKQEFQITHFGQEMKDHEIQILSWAPNSTAIAFSIVGVLETDDGGITFTDNGAIGIITVPDFNLTWVNLRGFENPILYNEFLPGATTFWWSKDSQELLIPYNMAMGDHNGSFLAWYDRTLDKVVHLLSDTDFPEKGDFWNVFPINGLDKIGILGAKALYIYQRNSKEITTVKEEFSLLENSTFLTALNGPIDPAQCSGH